MVGGNSKREGYDMIKFLLISTFFFNLLFLPVYSKSDLYKKIDLFGEVLEKIQKEYVDEINQSEGMEAATDLSLIHI